MRYAIFSDLHANWQAWSAVYADMQECGAQELVCLGDVVGYGPRPEEVFQSVRSVCGNFVLGNHDAAVCGRMDASIFNDNARTIVEWTRGVLSGESVRYFSSIPLTLEGGSDVLMVHAEIEDPGRFGYIIKPTDAVKNLAATGATITFVGHTHEPCVFVGRLGTATKNPPEDFQIRPHERYIVNVGSAGEPRDWNISASYVLYDTHTGQVTFRRVPFDVPAYEADLAEVGLGITPWFVTAYHDIQTGHRPPEDDGGAAARSAMTARLNIPVQSTAGARIKMSMGGPAGAAPTVQPGKRTRPKKPPRDGPDHLFWIILNAIVVVGLIIAFWLVLR